MIANGENFKNDISYILSDIDDSNWCDKEKIIHKIETIKEKLNTVRKEAEKNTKLYLSTVNDMDVYVATSMRRKDHFINMANMCNSVFADEELKKLNINYFDPTISIMSSKEDKGLLECLMVKVAKALLYCDGEEDTYGKAAEASMSLSLGKPVILLPIMIEQRCLGKSSISRIIDFKSGVAVGAIITNIKIFKILNVFSKIKCSIN